MYSTPKTIHIYTCIVHTIYQYNITKQELFIDKHEGISSNKVYAQAKITSYEDGRLLRQAPKKEPLENYSATV